jgi:hypothetical protein
MDESRSPWNATEAASQGETIQIRGREYEAD